MMITNFLLRSFVAMIVLSLMACSLLIQREWYDNYAAICDSAMASRMASLHSKTAYNCIDELQTGSRIIKSDATNTKGVGPDSAAALGKSHANIERDNANQSQNADTIEVNTITATDLSALTAGTLNGPNSNTHAATTGGKTTDEQLREHTAEINTLKAKLKAFQQ